MTNQYDVRYRRTAQRSGVKAKTATASFLRTPFCFGLNLVNQWRDAKKLTFQLNHKNVSSRTEKRFCGKLECTIWPVIRPFSDIKTKKAGHIFMLSTEFPTGVDNYADVISNAPSSVADSLAITA